LLPEDSSMVSRPLGRDWTIPSTRLICIALRISSSEALSLAYFRFSLIEMRMETLTNLRSRDAAVLSRQADDLVARMLDGSSLMDRDVTRLGSHHALMGTEDRRNNGSIGLRASDKEMHISLLGRESASLEDEFTGMLAMRIHPVTYVLFEIRLSKALQDFGSTTFVVITLELYHNYIRIKSSGVQM